MIRAIDQGEEGIAAAYSTAMHLLDFGFDYLTSCGSEAIYEEGLMKIKKTSEKLD